MNLHTGVFSVAHHTRHTAHTHTTTEPLPQTTYNDTQHTTKAQQLTQQHHSNNTEERRREERKRRERERQERKRKRKRRIHPNIPYKLITEYSYIFAPFFVAIRDTVTCLSLLELEMYLLVPPW